MESIYERCLRRELELRGISVVNQQTVRIEYKGVTFEEALRFDLLLDGCLLLELKSVQEITPMHKAQLLSYMKLMNIPVGLLINFHQEKVNDGITRMMLAGANRQRETM